MQDFNCAKRLWVFFGWNIEHCVPDLLGLFDSIGMFGLSCWLSDKESSCQCRRCRFDPWVGEILWRRKWQPTAVFLPGKSHEQRILAGYSLWDSKRVRHNLADKQQQQTGVFLPVINRSYLWESRSNPVSWNCTPESCELKLSGYEHSALELRHAQLTQHYASV